MCNCKHVSSMYSNTTTIFGFCDIQNNQAFGKDYEPKPKALIILDITNTWIHFFSGLDNLDFDYSGFHRNFIQ